ncbi:MAG: sodium:proline symporter, partial [Bacteroidota bacterium]
FVMIYSSLSGLLGVSIADFFQFILAMSGTIILAFLVVNSEKIGGMSGLKEKLAPETLEFLPQLNFSGKSLAEQGQVFIISFATFFAYVGVQWWASWYPGAEPGGGGYVAQRMMSTPKEKDALKATLFFQIAHYAIRPLPWIIVALCAIHLYPDLGVDDKKMGYVLAMRDFLPSGLRGLLLVAFLAAYMSTISTQLNWGSSYVINDLYQRFIRPEANQKQLVWASRVATFLLMVVALIVTSQIDTLENAFKFMIEAGAGLGAVLILRWYWWRINAWSEISATIAPFFGFALALYYKLAFPYSLFLTAGITTIIWVLVTFLTKPTQMRQLKDFYLRVEPQGAWKPVIQELGISQPPNQIPQLLLACISAMLMAYSVLFLVGELLFMNWYSALIYGGILLVSFLSLRWVSGRLQIFQD